MSANQPPTVNAGGLFPNMPSEVALLDLLLDSPGAYTVRDEDLSTLRDLRIALNETLIDAAAAVQKAELRRSGANDAAAAHQEQVIADALESAAKMRVKANVEIRRLLSADQLRRASEALAGTRLATDAAWVSARAEAGASRDQRVVEIETAALVTERVLSWAKLFAAAVAVPAALLIATLTVIGISKFSDFTKLVNDSEEQLRSTLAGATTNANHLAQRLADVSKQQSESTRRLDAVTEQLSSVREKLGMAPGTNITPGVQRELQGQFKKFQDYVIALGYTPGEREITVAVSPDGQVAYYSNNTIFIPKGWERDAQVIYREYLHHVLYSKIGPNNIGPERSALESGVADYLVASYSGSPRVYAVAFGTAVNLESAAKVRPATDHADRFPIGQSWASLFWQLRQNVGRAQIDRAVWSAWFDLGKDLPDRSIPNEMTSRLVARASGDDSASRNVVRTILQQRGAPPPSTP